MTNNLLIYRCLWAPLLHLHHLHLNMSTNTFVLSLRLWACRFLVPPWPTNSVTLTDRNANVHKQVSLGKGSRCLKGLFFPTCLSRYFHPSANEISAALSSCGYTGISRITSNKQPADELEFRACENMNQKSKFALKNLPTPSERVQVKASVSGPTLCRSVGTKDFSHGFAFSHVWV